MSAYIVSHKHIDLLVDELTKPGDLYTSRSMIAHGDKDAVGQTLIDENIKSVSYRYRGESLDSLPGPIDKSDLVDYHYTPGAAFGMDHYQVQILKAVQGYTYQSCEHPGWAESQAARWMEALTSQTISSLPGYQEAAWSL
jgi:hypothetical protein